MQKIIIAINFALFATFSTSLTSTETILLKCECNLESNCYTMKIFENLVNESSKFVVENCENLKFDEIKELQISWMINGIKKDLTDFENLKVLKISNSNLGENFEIKFSNLEILKLSENKIQNFPIFKDLEIFSGNREKFGKISKKLKRSSKNLKRFSKFKNYPKTENLSKNLKFKNFEKISQNSKVEKLFLDKNEISILKNLKNLQNLKILNLESNKIFYISSEAFFDLPELFHLNLNHNELISIEISTFSKNLKLTELNLNWNHLKYIHDLQFSSNLNLKFLRLRGNFLKIIKRIFFINNSNLEWIDLAENQIQFIQPKIFGNSLNLQFVDLTENKCIYEWFYVPKNRNGMEKLIEWSCHELSGINFLDSEEINDEL